MFEHTQPPTVARHYAATAEEDAGGGGSGDSPDNHLVPYDAEYGDAGPEAVQQTECSNQLTISFRGQVFVFDDVTTDKVQAVLLLLGASELSTAIQNGEIPGYQSQRDMVDYPVKCSQPHRAASLSRYRLKRKNRCFDKKIRYDVRQEVAFRMQRNKGQFTSTKKSEDYMGCNSGEQSGQDDCPLETTCTHCGTSSKSTPMMRRGPHGPRTLCNACGLFWANKKTMRDLTKKVQENALTTAEQKEGGSFTSKYEASIHTELPSAQTDPFSGSDNS